MITASVTMNYSCKTKTFPPSTIFCLFCCYCCCCCLLCLHQFYTLNHPSPLFFPESKFLFNLKADDYFKNTEQSNSLEIDGGERGSMRGARRLLLGGPGSSPPRCAFKCGGCMPCRPVHVPIPPGTRVTTEYYPEAWRCKCGNKFYTP